MARDHARIYCSIWSDPAFRDLTESAQGMYFKLVSQPRLSYCGVLDYLPTRIAKLARNSTIRSVNLAVSALENDGFVVRDDETGELLVRSFVRHDGLLDSPNMTKAMVTAFETVLSDDLQAALVAELSRAYAGDSTLKGWPAMRDKSPALFSMVSAKGSRKGSANG